jgi:hypothetical protein
MGPGLDKICDSILPGKDAAGQRLYHRKIITAEDTESTEEIQRKKLNEIPYPLW